MMTGAEAYWFGLAMISGLLAVVLPVMLLLMAPRAAWPRSLAAGGAGWAGASAVATLLAFALPGGPLRSGRAPADDMAVLFVIAATLAVVLAATGGAMVLLFRDLGQMPAEQVPPTVAVIVGCWLLVVGLFGWAVLA